MATATKKNLKKAKEAKKAQYLDQHTGVPLHGQIVTWQAAGPHSHKSVVEALKDSGLDEKLARELLPRHAFTRAAKKLSDNRIIELFREQENNIRFQFTKQFFKEEGIEYAKETFVDLNKLTGVVKCEDLNIQELAQKTLDACMVERTTSDITNIVQKLFQKHAEIIPVREQGGAYFVPRIYTEFVDRIGAFLSRLGGKLSLWPIAAGTAQGDKTVVDSVTDYMGSLVQEHKVAVEGFGVDTRRDVLERAAERIKTTKIKLEAYSEWLGDQREKLAEALVENEKALLEQIDKVAATQASKPKVEFKAFRENSKGAKVHAVLTVEPKPLEEVAAVVGWTTKRLIGHIRYWINHGAPYHLNGQNTVHLTE